MRHSKSAIILIVIFILFFISCKKDSDNSAADISHLLPITSDLVFKATVNGLDFEASEDWIIGSFTAAEEGYYIGAQGRMFSPTDTFVVSARFESADLSDYSDGMPFSDTNDYQDHYFSPGITYIGGDGAYHLDFGSSTVEGSGNVIALDTISHKFSGTFSFEYESGEGNILQISSGYFTNIPYE